MRGLVIKNPKLSNMAPNEEKERRVKIGIVFPIRLFIYCHSLIEAVANKSDW